MVFEKPSPSPSTARPLADSLKSATASKPHAPVKEAGYRAWKSFLAYPFWSGLGLSAIWVGGVAAAIAGGGVSGTLMGVPLSTWAVGISAAVSPVALVWMIGAYLQRASDIQSIAEPLRRQLSLITGESGAAEARIRRFNQAVKEQIELLRSAQNLSQDDLQTMMDRVRVHRADFERFEQANIHQVREIQDVIRRSMQQIEQMMDDKFTMLRVLDDKLVQNGDSVARQVDSVHHQVTRLLGELDSNSTRIADTLERVTRDSKKLSDVSRAQEASLTAAAETAAETLGGLSGKIDMSVARFLERASSTREEAERLAHALDAQTRALDEFSNTLPGRVSDAEMILRGVADRLYASEQLAREQAVLLSEKLSAQVDGLQGFMDRFTVRLDDINGDLQKRRYDLDSLADRMGATTSDFVKNWERSVEDLSDRANNTLLRFTVVNDETRRNAESVAAHLSTTTATYEDVVTRMRVLSAEGGAQIKAISDSLSGHLSQYDTLIKASRQVGEEVQTRATAATQSLQHILERLLATREATQSVGETLVRDLHNAVDQNEKLITRMNESAQMSVRALGIAAESLGRQEGELSSQTRAAEAMLQEAMLQLQNQSLAAEKGLRDQASNLMTLLAETQSQMVMTEQKMQGFANHAVQPVQKAVQQLETQSDLGMQALNKYGEGVGEQLARLQQFHGRVGGMSEELGKVTTDTIGSIEQLNARFSAVRTAQEETARQALAQYTDLAERLQREVTGLDGQSARAVETLQQAAARVGEQCYQLLQDAQNSGMQMKTITSALQGEATQIRAVLQKQADDLSADLSRAEKQFMTLGEAIQQRTDAAYALLDRVAMHYNDVTRNASQDLETRVQRLDQVTGQAQGRIESLNNVLTQQANLVGSNAAQLEVQSTQIISTSAKTIQTLSNLNEKITLTHDAANSNAQSIISRLEECNTAMMRQSNGLSEMAQNSTAMVQKSGAAFSEQATRVNEASRQIDQTMRQLGVAVTALADQTTHIRGSMEQHNQRLLAQMTEAVGQLDLANARIQQTANTAANTADQTAARYTDIAQMAGYRLNAVQTDMQGVADRAEQSLSALGVIVTQQSTSLNVLADQITAQQRELAAANDIQRQQLVNLFEKLGTAHSQASEVAERTIARLSESLQQIQSQLGAVSDQSQSTIGQVRAAGMGFAEQSTMLIQNAQNAEERARAILSVTSGLHEQAKQLRETMQSESDRSSDVLTALLSRLASGGSELRELGAATGSVLSGLHNNVVAQTQELTTSMQQIGERQRVLTSAFDAQREVMNGLLNRLTLAQDEAAMVSTRTAAQLADNAQSIERQIEMIGNRATAALSSVQTTASTFARESDNLQTYAQKAEEQSRILVASTSTLQDQARQHSETMQAESARAGEALGSLISRITGGTAELREAGASTATVLSNLQNGVTIQTQDLMTAMQQIAERQRAMTATYEAQREVMNGLLNRLTLAQDETATVSDRATTRLDENAQTIQRQIEAIDARATSALSSVQATASGFAREAEALQTFSQQAEEQGRALLAASSNLQDQARQQRDILHAESERTRDILTQLVGKITTGSAEVRDNSAATEMSLTSLQHNITQQTSGLTSAMQQIAERQRALTLALDAQRDVLNGLYSRLTTAQDETATVGERSASRLSDAASQMLRQIDAIGTQSQTALAGVQAAVSNFAEEAGTLALHAQQAEQNMRGVLNVTTGLQEQTRQLRETIEDNAARAVASLTAAVAQMDVSSDQIKTEGGAAAHALDQAAMRFAAAARAGAEALQQQTTTLDQTAQQSESRMNEAADKVRNHIRLVGEIGNEANTQARQIADSAEYAAMRLAALRDSMAETDRVGQETMHEYKERVEAMRSALGHELETLGNLTEQTVQKVAAAREAVSTQSDILRANVGMSESALTEAARLVREESAQLPAVIDRGAARIESAAQALKDSASDADKSLVGVADRFISVTGMARDTMAEDLRRTGAIASEAETVMQKFGQALAEQVAAMRQGMSMLSSEQRELVEKATESVTALTEAGDRITKLRAEATTTAERLLREYEMMDQRAESTGQRLVQAGDTLMKNTEAMGVMAERTESQILSASSGLRDQLERVRAGLQGQIDDINRGLMQITAQLERTGNTLRTTTVGTVADVERIAQRFDQTSREASGQLADRTTKLRDMTEQVATLLSGFGDQIDGLLNRMAQAGDGIRRQEGDLATQLQTALGHLATVADRLEKGRTMATEVSQYTSEKLGEVVDSLQQQIHGLTTSTQTATGIMRGIGQIYGEQTTSLTRGVGEAHKQVLDMNKSIDDMQQRADRMRQALKSQGDDLMTSLRQILTQLDMTGDALTDAVDRTLEKQVSEGLKKIS